MKKQHEDTAIILVNYNGTADTNECIKSLLKLDHEEYTIIVVDNGSTDSFVLDSELKSVDNIICLSSKKNLGFSGGNNLGIRFAKTKLNARYIMLLNNDTVVETDLLTAMIAAEKRHPNSIIGGKILYYSQKNLIWYAGGEFCRKNGSLEHTGFRTEDIGKDELDRKISFVTGCLMFFSSSVIDKIGYLPEEEFLYFEDTDYCCKAMNHGIQLIYTSKAIIYHKVSSSVRHRSKLQNYYMIRNGLYIIKKYVENKPIGYLHFIKKQMKFIVKRECAIGTFVIAVFDFLKGKKGKYHAA